MAPATLKACSLYADLEALFERAKTDRNRSLNALPEEEVANLLVEELAAVLVKAEGLIETICKRAEERRERIRLECRDNASERHARYAADVAASLHAAQ